MTVGNITLFYKWDPGHKSVTVSVGNDPATNGYRLCPDHKLAKEKECESCQIAESTAKVNKEVFPQPEIT